MKRARTIHLNAEVRKKITELFAVHGILLQHRNSQLGRLAGIFYGVVVGAGFILFMGLLKVGSWFELATPLFAVAVVCWLVARWITKVEMVKPLKISITP
jgi:tetrahydromethanopterin S-methyltransferase subunit G